MTKILKLNKSNKERLLEECSDCLSTEGAFLLLPTETVYGLTCSYNDQKAQKRIYQAKKRPEEKPFQVFVSDLEMLESTDAKTCSLTKKIIQRFCPGPITIVICTKCFNKKIGFRIPEHDFTLSLLKYIKKPLSATSANLSGQPPALNIKSALESLKLEPNLAIDGGNIPRNSLASTVIEILDDSIKLLREGPISLEKIRKEIGF